MIMPATQVWQVDLLTSKVTYLWGHRQIFGETVLSGEFLRRCYSSFCSFCMLFWLCSCFVSVQTWILNPARSSVPYSSSWLGMGVTLWTAGENCKQHSPKEPCPRAQLPTGWTGSKKEKQAPKTDHAPGDPGQCAQQTTWREWDKWLSRTKDRQLQRSQKLWAWERRQCLRWWRRICICQSWLLRWFRGSWHKNRRNSEWECAAWTSHHFKKTPPSCRKLFQEMKAPSVWGKLRPSSLQPNGQGVARTRSDLTKLSGHAPWPSPCWLHSWIATVLSMQSSPPGERPLTPMLIVTHWEGSERRFAKRGPTCGKEDSFFYTTTMPALTPQFQPWPTSVPMTWIWCHTHLTLLIWCPVTSFSSQDWSQSSEGISSGECQRCRTLSWWFSEGSLQKSSGIAWIPYPSDGWNA